MKRFIKKFRTFLETEYEVPLPKRPSKKQIYTKKPTNYVNPFKVQQELEENRKAKELEVLQKLAKAKLAEQERKAALERLAQEKHAERERQKELERLAKLQREEERKAVQTAALPAKTPPPPTLNQTAPVKPKKPTFFDKKLVIKIKKPQLPKLSFRKHVANKPTTDILHKARMRHPRIILGIVAAGVLATGIFVYAPWKPFSPPANPKTSDSPEMQARQITPPAAKLAAEVGKKVALPTDEEPDSATVIDRNKLQNQDFFKNAQNGDKILMYKRNQKAFLYRTSTDEIIAVATLVFQDTAGVATASASFTEATSL